MGTVSPFLRKVNDPDIGQWPSNEDELWKIIREIRTIVHAELKYRDRNYTCEIFYKNSNGSSVFAKSNSDNRLIAMQECLTEVARLW